MPRETFRKVVLRSRSGKLIPGFAYQTDFNETVKILTREGKEEVFPLSELKAVFFVREFGGDPQHEEIQFLAKVPASRELWVRAQFIDGEMLEGKVQNGLDLITKEGFYLYPSDGEANNLCVFVPKSALAAFWVLAPDE
ncbi:MAG TPA: hypothetical protein PLP42_11115 [Acidobacteriota bacterium]|nr:hypothetical protein [Acidobacteriota bacterium]